MNRLVFWIAVGIGPVNFLCGLAIGLHRQTPADCPKPPERVRHTITTLTLPMSQGPDRIWLTQRVVEDR